MNEYIAKDGERLDQIVYEVYGTLDVFQDALKANIHIANKIELDVGDKVYLPDISVEPKEQEEKALW